MEESESLSKSCESSPCVTNVKKFVHEFEQTSPISREDSFIESKNNRDTMTKTSFRKLKELKNNLEQSMHQRYNSNKNIQNIGKPISQLKDALKKSIENLSTKSFSSKSYTPCPAVRLRYKSSCGYLNTSKDPFLQNQRSIFGSTKIRPIPLPKPKLSSKAKKYKSISDLSDTRQSVIFEDIEFNGKNDVFKHSRGSASPSRLSCDVSRLLKISEHSSSNLQPSSFSLDLSSDSIELPFINSHQSISSSPIFKPITTKYSFFHEPCLNKQESLSFEPIGETCTNEMNEDVSSLLHDDHHNTEFEEALHFEKIGETSTEDFDNEILDSTITMKNNILSFVSSTLSESFDNDDFNERGSYYIHSQDYPNESTSDLFFPIPNTPNIENTNLVFAAKRYSAVEINHLNLASQSLQNLSQIIHASDESPLGNLETNHEHPASNDLLNNACKLQVSTRKPCLMVSPLQNPQQASPSIHPDTALFIHIEQSSYSSDIKPLTDPTSINPSHIINTPVFLKVHCFFSEMLGYLSCTHPKDDQFIDIMGLSKLLSNPLSGFDKISQVFSLPSTHQCLLNEPLLHSNKQKDLLEVCECLIEQVKVLEGETITATISHNNNISKLKDMVGVYVVDEDKEGCLKKMDELLAQVQQVSSLLFLLNKMSCRKKYCNLKSIKTNTGDDSLDEKLADAKDLKVSMDNKYLSMLSYLANNSNQETCDFYIDLIHHILHLKFQKEFASHKLFQLQRASSILSLFVVP